MTANHSDDSQEVSGLRVYRNAGMKLIVIVCLVLLALVPLALIRDLLSERQMRHDEAIGNITSTWGGPQTIVGPILVVPYHRNIGVWRDPQGGGQAQQGEPTEKALAHAYFLPEALAVNGRLLPERLHRGIYEAIVFRSALEVSGQFRGPSFAEWKIPEEDVLWNEATVIMSVTDLRGVNQALSIKWGDAQLALVPGRTSETFGPLVQARVPLSPGSQSIPFQLTLNLVGSKYLWFAPLGAQTRVRLTSTFPDPSFQGCFLPAHRTVSSSGFEAEWEVSYYGRSYPQSWSDHAGDPLKGDALRKSLFGLAVQPVLDSYRYVERSIKYGILILALVFSAFFLFEVRSLVRIHPIQYTLLGAALCLFYLGVLSLSELIPFGWAYLIGACASTLLVAGYSAYVLKAARRAWTVAAGLTLIYGYMYVILRQEEHALLYGTIALFVALAAVMYGTRNIDWYSLGKESNTRAVPASPAPERDPKAALS